MDNRICIHRNTVAGFSDGIQKKVEWSETPGEAGIGLFNELKDKYGLIDGIGADIKLSATLHSDTVVESVFILDVGLTDGQYDIKMVVENNGQRSESNLKTRNIEGLFDYVKTNLVIWSSAHYDETDKVLGTLNQRLMVEYQKSLI